MYSCVQEGVEEEYGTIVADPLFKDPSGNNVHLLAGTPCIDAGTTWTLFGEYQQDIDGECRLAGEGVDMGVDEFGSSIDSDGDLLC